MTHGHELRGECRWERVEREWGGKVQGIRSINGRYKIDRGWLRIV